MSNIELGTTATEVHKQPANPTYEYLEKEEHVRGFLSKQFPTIANPAPLGLFSFALTLFTLSMSNAGAASDLRGAHGVPTGMVFAYGGIVQLLAGMWEFKTGNTFGATIFSSYGGFCIGYASLFIDAFGFLDGYAGDADQLNQDLGVLLIAWCIFSCIMTIGAQRSTLVLLVIMLFVDATFLMLGIHHFYLARHYVLQQAGGALGIIAGMLAWYAGLAGLLTEKNSLFQLPVWPMDPIWRHYGFLPACAESTDSKH